jgi:uncharacterized protein
MIAGLAMLTRITMLALVAGGGEEGDKTPPPPQNRLAAEKSPYLRHHADDPVAWQPWGDAAFAAAKREDKLVFLSSGYSACHWCHVMERESFENAEIAALLNQQFIAVKLDREERPDVDAIYLDYVVARTGSGGWPLTVILTPDRQPIFGGTYFPPRNSDRGAGLFELLTVIADEWKTNREEVVAAGAEAAQWLERNLAVGAPGEWSSDIASRTLLSWTEMQEIRGERRRGPLFPQPMMLRLALECEWGDADDAIARAALAELDAMAAGGLRDPIGGGFARYSVDGDWKVPHFEKMLYVNALLARAYTVAFQRTQAPRFERVARETLDYLLREMALEGGGFAAAQDADSLAPNGESIEGYYYTFVPDDLAALDPKLARTAMMSFSVTERGDLDGRSVPRRPPDAAGPSDEIEAARAALATIRATRPPPARDDKVLTDWNALAISAFALAGRVLGEPRYRAAAGQCAEFVRAQCFDADARSLARRYCDGEVAHAGQLSDYAYFADALLDLYELDFEVRHLDLALEVLEGMLARFFDAKSGVFFDAPSDGEALLVRPRDAADGALPSPTGIALRVVTRASRLTGRVELEELAERCLAVYADVVRGSPFAHPTILQSAVLAFGPSREVVFAGTRREASFESLVSKWYSKPRPAFVVAHAPADSASRSAASAVGALIEGRDRVGDRSAAFICSNRICAEPVTDPEQIEAALRMITPSVEEK